MEQQTPATRNGNGTEPQYEVIIIGAGVCGIYQLYRLVELGVHTTVLEGGADLGGTWYWNRYPGCRFDSESYTYGYSFSKELLDEWHWKERFSGQPENLRYLNHVADKFDLRRHMQFNCLVESARFDEERTIWRLQLQDGRELTCRFLLTALGLLSAPTMPRIEGIESFEGQSFHTYHWPQEPVELAGKRVAVIGTGATGVQVIAAIAEEVGGPDRLPAATQLVRAAEQRRDLRRGDGRHPRPLRRDLRQVPPHAGRLRARARPARLLRRVARGAGRAVGAAVRRAGLRHLAQQLPRDLHRRGSQRRVLRVHRRQDPLDGWTTRSSPRS